MIRKQLEITPDKVWYSIHADEYQTFVRLYEYMKATSVPCYITGAFWWEFNARNPTTDPNFAFKGNIGFKSEKGAFRFFLACPTPKISHKLLKGYF